MKIHLSVDDVFSSLLAVSGKEYQGVFEHPFFSFLLQMHQRYGCQFSCYVFYGDQKGNTLCDISDRHAAEFFKNRHWLSFSYHADHAGRNTLETDYRFTAQTLRELFRITGGAVDLSFVRLHYWMGSKECMDTLKHAGIHGFLCPDTEKPSYDLSNKECQVLFQKGIFYRDGLTYLKTSVRIEHLPWFYQKSDFQVFIDQCKTLEIPLVIFTHEWALNRRNKRKLEHFLRFLTNGGKTEWIK